MSGFWGLFKRGRESEHKTTKNKTPKLQTRKPHSPVTKRRKQTTPTQNNATSLFRLQETTQEQKRKKTSMKHKKQTTF